MFGVCIEQPSNHALILGVIFMCLGFEKIDATLAKCNGDLDPFLLKRKILRPRQEISDDLGVSEHFVRVLYFRVHKFVCLFSSNQHRIFESHLRDR